MSFGRKTGFFFAILSKIFVFAPPPRGPCTGENVPASERGLANFGRGGGPKNRKNREKIENFQPLKIGPKVKISTYGCEFGPKKCVFHDKNVGGAIMGKVSQHDDLANCDLHGLSTV